MFDNSFSWSGDNAFQYSFTDSNAFRGDYPVGSDYVAQFNYQRQQASSAAFGQIFDVFGGIASKFMQAQAARDYADQLAEAAAARRANALKVAQYQAESTLTAARYQADLLNQNASVLTGNAINMQTAALKEREQVFGYALRSVGEARQAYSASGVAVGVGSAADVERKTLDNGIDTMNNRYQGRINQIADTLNNATRQQLEAKFSVWSAEEQAKFIKLNADLRTE